MNMNEVAFKEYFHRIYELLETDRARIADFIEDSPDLTDLADRLEYELEAGHGEWASEVNESYNREIIELLDLLDGNGFDVKYNVDYTFIYIRVVNKDEN